MRLLVMVSGLAALAILISASTEAQAKTFALKGTYTRAQIADACNRAEMAGDNVLAGGTDGTGPYECSNVTTGTSVSCTAKGHCTATVPGKRVLTGTGTRLLDRLLQVFESAGAAPDTTSAPPHNKKPPKVFNLNDGNDGSSGGKSGTPMGQGGKPVKNNGGGSGGGGKTVTPHNFVFAKPHPIS